MVSGVMLLDCVESLPLRIDKSQLQYYGDGIRKTKKKRVAGGNGETVSSDQTNWLGIKTEVVA